MESPTLKIYTLYNSTIDQGKRVRRMRRTQLSAEKVANNLSTKKAQMTKNISRSKQQSHSHSRSHPKIQPKWTKQANGRSRATHLANVQNQYFSKEINVSQFNHQKKGQFLNSIHNTKKENQSNLLQNKSKILSAENSYSKNNKLIVQNSKNSGYISDHSQSQKSSFVNVPTKNKQLQNVKKNTSRKTQRRNQQYQSKSIQHKKEFVENKPLRLNQYGLKTQKSKLNSQNQSVINSNNIKSSFKQSINSGNSKLQLNKSRNSYNPKGSNQNSIQNSIENGIKNSFSKSRQKASSNTRKLVDRQPQNLHQASSNLSNQYTNQKQVFSKLKVDQILQNQIINISQTKRESWNDAIKSLTSAQNQQQHVQKNRQSNLVDSKKIELKLDSQRQDNMSTSILKSQIQKHSWKNLPLNSKEPSYRKSFDMLSQKSAEPGSLKFVLEHIQYHDFIIQMIEQFQQQTEIHNQSQDNIDIICFLLRKKFFYEKSNIIKALRGGKNIFRLTTLQIQTQVLQKYLQTQQIQSLVKQMQQNNTQLFKSLQKQYQQLKQKYANTSKQLGLTYLKLESRQDDFTIEIVRFLSKQLERLNQELRVLDQNEQQMQEVYQGRIFNIMQMVFIMSQLSGRKVKKIQFFDQVDDFQLYYQRNVEEYKRTLQYFFNPK